MAFRAFTLIAFCLTLAPWPAIGQQTPPGQASIEGRTTSPDGQPLRKTNLVLRPLPVAGGRGAAGAGAGPIQPPAPFAATSDAEGKFSFTGLDAGRYTLMADHPGYLNTQYGVKRTPGGGQNGNAILTLTDGQHMTGVTIQLSPQATISGKVTDEDGDPMVRVRVNASRRMYGLGQARLTVVAAAISDDNGDFHLTNLPAGRYYISFAPIRAGGAQPTRRSGSDAAAQEMGYGTVYFPGAPDMEGAIAVDAAEGQDRAGINVHMHKVPVYHVRGTIGGDLPPADTTLPAGMGNRLQLSVGPQGSTMMGNLNMQMTNSDGSFDIGGLTPGVWSVSLLRVQGQVQTVTQATVVVADHDVDEFKLMARNPADITGTVRIMPEGATVAAPSAPSQQGQTQGQGQAEAQSMPAAFARVNQVTLQPVDGIGMGGSVQPAQVKADGSFTIKNVGPLKYQVFANAPAGGYLKSATLNGQDALRSGVDMSSGGQLDLVVSMTAAEIDGTVTGADGQPATDATITIVPDPAQPGRRDVYKQVRTRADGSFTAMGLVPGKYRIYAWEEPEPGAYMDPDYMQPFESLGTVISVDDNDKKTVALTVISKTKADDVNHRAGR